MFTTPRNHRVPRMTRQVVALICGGEATLWVVTYMALYSAFDPHTANCNITLFFGQELDSVYIKSTMELKALHNLWGPKPNSVPQDVFDVWDNLTVTKAIRAFVVLSIIVPKLFGVGNHSEAHVDPANSSQFLQNLFSPIFSIPGPLINKFSPWPLEIATFKGKR